MNSPAGSGWNPKVVIVGTGLGGIGVAIQLKQAGHNNLVLLEQAPDLGGVWRDNGYPGAACDVPSALYTYSFERFNRFSHRYPGQPQIHEYIRKTADKYGITQHIKFNAKVTSATFDESAGQWVITTEAGEHITADFFVPAVGTLARPRYPSIPGREKFEGPAFHSARWNHDVDLTGKRVAVIGTGASALQFVPQIQPKVAQLTVFQRSAPYIMPLHNYTYEKGWRKILASKAFQLWDRFSFWYLMEFGQQILTRNSWRWLGNMPKSMTLGQLKKQVQDPELRAKLTPTDEFGCKRVLFSSKYYPALTQPNASVVTEKIEEMTATGVRTADGVEHEFDVVIYGTGFMTDDILGHIAITGKDNRVLADQWKEGAHAYLGIAVPGFPNMFLVYGPNTDLGSGSIPFMLESQFNYIREAMNKLSTIPNVVVNVKEEVWERFDAEIQERAKQTTWVTGCSNWYTNEFGRVVTNWPQRSWRYRRRTKKFDISKYDVRTVDATEKADATS